MGDEARERLKVTMKPVEIVQYELKQLESPNGFELGGGL